MNHIPMGEYQKELNIIKMEHKTKTVSSLPLYNHDKVCRRQKENMLEENLRKHHYFE